MTKPIYFPHTYLPPATAAAMRSAFAAVVAYPPVAGRLPPDMRALVESGFLEVVAPAAEDEERLERALREYEQWGRRQQGGAGLLAVFLSDRPGADPLMADGTATQIASQIRRRPAGEPPSTAHAACRCAAVFLQLAQQADEQGYQVREELGRSERAHAGLLKALAGKAPAPEVCRPPHPEAAPEADLLLEHRLRAWARLFAQRPYASPVFVTASPKVIELLAEKFPTMRRIGRTALNGTAGERRSPAPPSRGDLMLRLESLASLPLPDPAASDEDLGTLPEVYVVPDLAPRRLFAGLAANEDAAGATAALPDWRHTVIVGLAGRTP